MTTSFVEFFEKKISELRKKLETHLKNADAYQQCKMYKPAADEREKAKYVRARIYHFENRIRDIKWKEEYDRKQRRP